MRNLQFWVIAGIASALVSGSAFGQDKPSAPLAFEVATIKPSEVPTMGGKIMIRMGVTNDGQMVTYSRMTIRGLVVNAYGMKDYQVIGAPWMDQQFFDISAKMPDGANKDQAPEMLQALLKERFKVTIHREKRDHNIYALVAGKSGPKLKETDPNAADFKLPPGAPPLPLPPPGAGGGGGGRVQFGGAQPDGAGGRGGRPDTPRMMMQMGPNGGHLEIRNTTLADFANSLSRYVDRPVMDETAIQGKYDFALDVSSDDMANMKAGSMGGAMMGAMVMARQISGGPAGGPGPAGDGPAPGGPEGGSIFQSIQSYGLKLEPKKAPMDAIIIDGAEKSPTEN